MHLLVAPDKFAGSLTAVEAATAIAIGWCRADPTAVLDVVPLSDGGPGFIAVLHAALGGELSTHVVTGPLGEPVHGQLLIAELSGVRTAYIESAQACGLTLVEPSPAAAEQASTIGVGQLLRAAVSAGVDRVVVGVGGTATTDGGLGCLAAYGERDDWPARVELVVASDVTAPLLGPNGAARLFGPQKGADPPTVERLEQRLAGWAERSGGPSTAEGAGAGGGLGYGLLLLGASVIPGLATVMDAVGLHERIARADLVVTGEGRVDRSSMLGKVPGGVATLARHQRTPCVVLAGVSLLAPSDLVGTGITSVHTLAETYGLESALSHPGDRLADLAEHVARARAGGVPLG